MPFEIVFDKAKEFAKVITTASNLIDEATFKATKEGILMRALDPSRVVLIDLDLPESVFAKYDVEREETIGINMKHFKKILKRGKDNDTLILRKDKNAFLEIIFQGSATRKFKLPLIEVDELELDIPELPFTVKAVLLSDTLKEAIKDAMLISDCLFFVAKEDEFIMRAEGETTELKITFTIEEEGLLDIDVKEESKSAYGIGYLNDMVKEIDRTKEVTLWFGNKTPLQLSYPIRDEGKLTFLLAPRVEE